MKIGVLLESMPAAQRKKILDQAIKETHESNEHEHLTSGAVLLQYLLEGRHNEILMTPGLLGPLCAQCKHIGGKHTGYPHLCGSTVPCGKNDDRSVFLEKARAHAAGGKLEVSAGYSSIKAEFLILLVRDFNEGKISGEKVAAASDREAARMLIGHNGGLKGIGDWVSSQGSNPRLLLAP